MFRIIRMYAMVILVSVCAGCLFLLWQMIFSEKWSNNTMNDHAVVPEIIEERDVELVEQNVVVASAVPDTFLPGTHIIPSVPFTVQAPNAEWSNPLFQDACEEAAIIMADAWVNKKTLSRDGVKKEIESLALFEKKHFGQAVDTSLTDTAWLLREYFSLATTEIEIKKNIVIEDMKRALALGKIVIVPTDGRKLKNPNFKQPGPERHMVLVKGYDHVTREFIVNDPGTRKGESYRYGESILFEAILDYATGDHAPVMSTDKVMLTVWKE